MLTLLVPWAFAEDGRIAASLHGDVKSFFLASGSVPWFGLSDDTLERLGMTEDEARAAFGLPSGATGQ